jgi:hypothetical protein
MKWATVSVIHVWLRTVIMLLDQFCSSANKLEGRKTYVFDKPSFGANLGTPAPNSFFPDCLSSPPASDVSAN